MDYSKSTDLKTELTFHLFIWNHINAYVIRLCFSQNQE